MIAHPHVSVAAKYGAILAGKKGPVVRLRDGCRQARRRMSEAPLDCSGRFVLAAVGLRCAIRLAFDLEDDGAFDQAVQESHGQRTVGQIVSPFFEIHSAVERF